MLLCHPLIRPSWTCTGGTFATSNASLVSRSPQDVCRINWPAGNQTTATTCVLTTTFAAQTIGAAALLATTLPAGCKVEVRGKRASDSGYTYALGGNALTQPIGTFADGTRGMIWVFDAVDELVGLQITIYNDVAGAAVMAAGEAIDIGEIAAGMALRVWHKTGWVDDGVDPSALRRTLGSQIARVQRTGYRRISVTPTFGDIADTRTGGLSNGTDWTHTRAALRADPYCLLIVEPDLAADAQTTAIFGLATKIPSVTSLAGPYYQPATFVIEEIPG